MSCGIPAKEKNRKKEEISVKCVFSSQYSVIVNNVLLCSVIITCHVN